MNWANALTWSRLAMIVPSTIAAYLQMRGLVLGLFVVAGLTDVLDGPVARRTGVASAHGAALDNRVDVMLGLAVILWLRLLFPAFFAEFWPWMVCIVCLTAGELALTRLLVGRVAGLHLWSAKLAGLGVAVLLVSLTVFDDVSSLARAVIVVFLYARTEGIVYLAKGGKNLDARFFWDP